LNHRQLRPNLVEGLEDMDRSNMSGLWFSILATPVHQKCHDPGSFSRAGSNWRRSSTRISRHRLCPMVSDCESQGPTRCLEGAQLRISSPLLCLRQLPPLPRLPEPKYVRNHRLSEPRDISPTSSLPRTPRPTRSSAPVEPTWRETK
jgi:hypothetical protein